MPIILAARMVQPHRNREDFPCDLLNDLRWGPSIFRRILHQLFLEALPELSIPGFFLGQILDPLHQKLRGFMREVEHEFGSHLETVIPLA
jgi:hypothetical protein